VSREGAPSKKPKTEPAAGTPIWVWLVYGLGLLALVLYFVQSDVPETTELAWLLTSVTPMGWLEKAVSFKDKVQQGVDKAADIAKDKLPDEHDGKVDKIADAATDQINKLQG